MAENKKLAKSLQENEHEKRETTAHRKEIKSLLQNREIKFRKVDLNSGKW